MLEYNLTQRERQIVVRLLDLSRHSKDHFEARLIDPAAGGPLRELARLDFGGPGHSMELTKRDLRVLKDEGLIHFRWDRPDRGTGRLSSLAFSAVGSNFHDTPSSDAAAIYNDGGAVVRAGAGSDATEIGSEADLFLNWQIDRHWSAYFGYSHFWPGDFIDETGPSGDIDFVYAAVHFIF